MTVTGLESGCCYSYQYTCCGLTLEFPPRYTKAPPPQTGWLQWCTFVVVAGSEGCLLLCLGSILSKPALY